MRPNLAIKIGRLKLKNPVMAASGTFGEEYSPLVDMRSLGAIVAKTVTLKPRIGNPPPRVCETPSGMLNSIGLENKGLEHFLKDKLPALTKFKVPVIVSIAGDDEDEFAELARRLSGVKGIDAIEMNLSCPNITRRSRTNHERRTTNHEIIAQDEEAIGRIVKAVKRATKSTIITKLSPNVTDIAKMAKTAEEAGSDAISLVNTFPGMGVDIDTKKPLLGNVTGGLSGPAIKPLALRMVWEAYRKVKIPIIGLGGIMDWRDAIEFILCGASAVQVGTANFVDPGTPGKIVSGIQKYMRENAINDIKDLVGAIKI